MAAVIICSEFWAQEYKICQFLPFSHLFAMNRVLEFRGLTGIEIVYWGDLKEPGDREGESTNQVTFQLGIYTAHTLLCKDSPHQINPGGCTDFWKAMLLLCGATF